MIDWNKARAGLVAGAGTYLIYTAYSLFQERKTDTAMPLWLNCLFSGLFLLAAIAILVYAYSLWKKAKAEEKAAEERFALEEEVEKAAASGSEETVSEKIGTDSDTQNTD